MATIQISGMPAITAVTGADILHGQQSGIDVKITAAQIAQYAYVVSISALRAVLKTVNSFAFVTLGYYAAGDGGGGSLYLFDSTDTTSSDNGGTVIVATDGGRWKLTFKDRLNVRQFGAKGDGTTDDTAAIQAALTVAGTYNTTNTNGGFCVYMPSGKYKMGAVTMQHGTRLHGDGAFSTSLIPNAASITLITYSEATLGNASNIELDNFSIYCGTTASVQGLKISQARNCRVHDITFSGCLLAAEWDKGETHIVHGLISEGTYAGNKAGGYLWWSSDDTKYIFDVKVTACLVRNLGSGTQAFAFKIRRAVGFMGYGCNVNDMNTGNSTPQQGVIWENDCQGCHMTDGIFGACQEMVLFQTGTGVNVAPSFISMTGCDFDQSFTTNVLINNASWINITGCLFTSSGVTTTGSGLLIQNGSNHINIVGNQFVGWSGASGSGILLGASDTILIDGNTFTNNFQDIGIPGTNVTNCFVTGNRFTSANAVGGVWSGATNKASNNAGFNGQSKTSPPSFPATGVTITNTNSVGANVYLSGGTISSVVINGITVPTTQNSIQLFPGDTLAINYTGTVGWTWIAIP